MADADGKPETLGERPVAVRFGALGDTVMFLPVLEGLADRWGRKVDVLTSGSWSREILSHCGSVGDILVMTGTRRRPYLLSLSKRRAARWLAERPQSPILMFESANKIADVFQAAGVSESRVASLADLEPRSGEHQVGWHLRFVDAAFASERPADRCRTPQPVLDNRRIDRADLARWLGKKGLAERPLVLLQPGNKRTMRPWGRPHRPSNLKYWPVGCWATVIRGVVERIPDAAVLLCGVPGEHRFVAHISKAAGVGNAIPVARELPLRRLIALCSAAHSMISVDTGPAHIAAAVGCPLVVMFGGTDPRAFGPLGAGPVEYVTPASIDRPDSPRFGQLGGRMQDLQPGQVLDAWARATGLKVATQAAAALAGACG